MKNLKKILEDLSKRYGGLPSNGNFDIKTEYQVGMARMAEASHCILESIRKASKALEGDEMRNMRFRIEVEHIGEEIGIIKRCLDEYSRNLYVEMFNDRASMDDVENVRGQAKDLKRIAEENQRVLDNDKDKYREEMLIYNIAFNSFEVVINLCDSILERVDFIPVHDNVFEYRPLIRSVRDLDSYCQEYIDKYGG